MVNRLHKVIILSVSIALAIPAHARFLDRFSFFSPTDICGLVSKQEATWYAKCALAASAATCAATAVAGYLGFNYWKTAQKHTKARQEANNAQQQNADILEKKDDNEWELQHQISDLTTQVTQLSKEKGQLEAQISSLEWTGLASNNQENIRIAGLQAKLKSQADEIVRLTQENNALCSTKKCSTTSPQSSLPEQKRSVESKYVAESIDQNAISLALTAQAESIEWLHDWFNELITSFTTNLKTLRQTTDLGKSDFQKSLTQYIAEINRKCLPHIKQLQEKNTLLKQFAEHTSNEIAGEEQIDIFRKKILELHNANKEFNNANNDLYTQATKLSDENSTLRNMLIHANSTRDKALTENRILKLEIKCLKGNDANGKK